MAAGEPEGEAAWETARQMDPYQVVARALFDTLPPETGEEPTIEEWDEATWRQRRADEQPERIAATRPMEAVTPVGTLVGREAGSQTLPPPPPPADGAWRKSFLKGRMRRKYRLLDADFEPPASLSEARA